MEKRYAVGIDLGTSNSALALAPADSEDRPDILAVPQIFSFQAIGELDVLPSVLYLPLENEAKSAAARLPWEDEPIASGLVGQFAREQGTLMPDRMVVSAKSWLCSPHVNPEDPLLPWNSDLPADEKISPFHASVRYLRHLRQAFLTAQRDGGDATGSGFGDSLTPAPLPEGEGMRGTLPEMEGCEIVVTVPASFDEVARSLTHRAAQAAGWGK